LNGLKFLQKMYPEKKVENLRDVTLAELLAVKEKADPVVFKRIHHVMSENIRVFDASDSLKNGDVEALGKHLYASHKSLQYDFEVSCPELNAIVEIVAGVPGSVGARLTGAGFGGCAIALVRDSAVDATISAIKSKYPAQFPAIKDMVEVWPIQVADGSGVVYRQKALAGEAV
jgi:galactokinase